MAILQITKCMFVLDAYIICKDKTPVQSFSHFHAGYLKEKFLKSSGIVHVKKKKKYKKK